MGNARVPEYLNKNVLIDVCRDGTITYRLRGQPIFNGKALPTYSVDTEDEARALQVRFCRRQYTPHPLQLQRPWYKLSRLEDGTDPALTRADGCLVLDDLPGVARMFDAYMQGLQPLGRGPLEPEAL